MDPGLSQKSRAEFMAELAARCDGAIRAMIESRETNRDFSELLFHALERKLEHGVLTSIWLQVAQELELKLGLVREGSESTHHYHLIEQRLAALGEAMESFWAQWPGYGPLFWYHVDLKTKPEILAALFTRQALYCQESEHLLARAEAAGDQVTLHIYRETILPDERTFLTWGRSMLEKYLLSAWTREQALASARRSLELLAPSAPRVS